MYFDQALRFHLGIKLTLSAAKTAKLAKYITVFEGSRLVSYDDLFAFRYSGYDRGSSINGWELYNPLTVNFF